MRSDQPVQDGGEIEDVSAVVDSLHACLLGSKEDETALDAALYGAYGAGKAIVDEPDLAGSGDENVAGVDVGMDEAQLVDGGQSLADGEHDLDDDGQVGGLRILEVFALDRLHEKEDLADAEQTLLANLDGAAQNGMIDLTAKTILVEDLSDESLVLGLLPENML